MNKLPNDPVILLSYVNTMLRDKYRSLEDLASDLEEDYVEIEEKLALLNYSYNADRNQFV